MKKTYGWTKESWLAYKVWYADFWARLTMRRVHENIIEDPERNYD